MTWLLGNLRYPDGICWMSSRSYGVRLLSTVLVIHTSLASRTESFYKTLVCSLPRRSLATSGRRKARCVIMRYRHPTAQEDAYIGTGHVAYCQESSSVQKWWQCCDVRSRGLERTKASLRHAPSPTFGWNEMEAQTDFHSFASEHAVEHLASSGKPVRMV